MARVTINGMSSLRARSDQKNLNLRIHRNPGGKGETFYKSKNVNSNEIEILKILSRF